MNWFTLTASVREITLAPPDSQRFIAMANQEHLDIIKQGVDVWNKWRKANPEIKPDLSGADLSRVNFRFANLSRANLRRADLSGTILSKANLSRKNLSGQNLSNANLSNANLSNANLSGANLQEASLQTAMLINAKLDSAKLTNARIWETQRAGWSIKGVICESVYWDKEAKSKTPYSPGDFERLFAEKTRVRLVFKYGISPLEVATLPALIKHLEEAHPGCSLRLVSIHDDSGGAVVELAIENTDEQSPKQIKQLKAALETEAQRRVEHQRQALIERETRLHLEGEVKQLSSVVDKLISRHSITIYTEGGAMGDKYDISGQVGAVGPNAHAHDMTFNQLVNHVEQNIDLAELAKQIGELRQAMAERQDPSPQAAIAVGEVAKAEIAATEKNTSKVVEHLKSAGKWTLDFAKDMGKDLVVDLIKKATGMP
jgi:Pentapeptide repeats (8 copies)